MEIYDTLDSCDAEVRKMAVVECKLMAAKAIVALEAKLQKIDEEEKDVRAQQKRLKSIIMKTGKLLEKAAKNPKTQTEIPTLEETLAKVKKMYVEYTDKMTILKDQSLNLIGDAMKALEELA